MRFKDLAAYLGGFFCLYGIHTEKGMVKWPISALPGFGGFQPVFSFANLPSTIRRSTVFGALSRPASWTAADPVASRSLPGQVCAAQVDVCPHSAKWSRGRVSHRQISPIKSGAQPIVTAQDRICVRTPVMLLLDVHCATIFGRWEEPSGESRPMVVKFGCERSEFEGTLGNSGY